MPGGNEWTRASGSVIAPFQRHCGGLPSSSATEAHLPQNLRAFPTGGCFGWHGVAPSDCTPWASGVPACCQCATHCAKPVMMDRFSAEAFHDATKHERGSTAFFVDAVVCDLHRFPGTTHCELSPQYTGLGAVLSESTFGILVEAFGLPQITRPYGMAETFNVASRACRSDSLEVRVVRQRYRVTLSATRFHGSSCSTATGR